jgi:hypothetical protein
MNVAAPRIAIFERCRSEAAKFIVHKRQELVGRSRIAGFDPRQVLCTVGHDTDYTAARLSNLDWPTTKCRSRMNGKYVGFMAQSSEAE